MAMAALTSSSALDNLRPLVVVGSSGEGHVLFTQGTLRTYMDYSLDVMTLPL